MTSSPTIQDDERGALSVADAARWLGISQTCLRDLILCGDLPTARVGPGGGRHVVPLAELRRYLAERTSTAAAS